MLSNKTIVILDDEPDILELVALNLKKSGFKTIEFTSPVEFFNYLDNNCPDLFILDLMLPGTDGLEICKSLRVNQKFKYIPIIMLTAKTEEADKIIGLELGADDYVSKPFSPRELTARVKAILRRSVKKEINHDTLEVVKGLIIDPIKHEVILRGEKIDLTITEFKILHLLSVNKGILFSRNKILEELWGYEKAVIDRTIDVHIKHLRTKLGPLANIIKNIRGIGYKVDDLE